MAQVNLTSNPRIDFSDGDAEYVSAYPLINQYSIPGNPLTRHWFNCGETRFTAVRGLQYQFTHRLVGDISNVVCGLGEVLAVNCRVVLHDATTGYDVPSSVALHQAYLASGATTRYGQLNFIVSFNTYFKEGENELLIAGHKYAVRPQIEKEQSLGSPTCDVSLVRSVHDGDFAIRLNR